MPSSQLSAFKHRNFKMIAARIAVCVLGLQVAWNQVDAGCQSPYVNGSYWVERDELCKCVGGQYVCEGSIGHCDGRGDVHYYSFDRRKFDFQGVCRYILSRDCYKDSFTIEVEQRSWTKATSVTDKFTIRFGNYVINLDNPRILEVFVSGFGGVIHVSVGWSYDDSELRIEIIPGRILITLKNIGIHFTWNWQFNFDVYATKKHKGVLCGICADFDGDPKNDIGSTPFKEVFHSITQWGDSWRVANHNQPKRCQCQTTPDDDKDCRRHAAAQKQCDTLLKGQYFAACNKKVDPTPYIANCRVEMCACAKENKPGCLCIGASGLIEACRAAGVTIDMKWGYRYQCGGCKDPDTGEHCEHESTWRYKCVVRTCKDGKVEDKKDAMCCKFKNGYYLNGQSWTYNCYKYACVNGKATRDSKAKCCYVKGSTYMNGQTWKAGCYVYTCNNGRPIHSTSSKCCTFGSTSYPSGKTWTYKCYLYVCVNGRTVRRSLTSCCVYKGKTYMHGRGYTYNCHAYICLNGRFHRSPSKTCCVYGGKTYQNGQSWLYGCYQYTCIKGKSVRSSSSKCCVFGGKTYKEGESWMHNCLEYKCVNGHPFCDQKLRCCIYGGKKYMNGQTWMQGCYKYTCIKGKPVRSGSSKCCVYGGKIYMNGQSWYHGCYKYTCINGKYVHHASSTCCVFRGKKYMNGQSWTYGCYQYTCIKGKSVRSSSSTCSMKKSCVFKGKTYKNGVSWMHACYQYTCVNGHSYCDQKLKCCVHRGKIYTIGKWVLGGVCKWCKCGHDGRFACKQYHIKCKRGYKAVKPCKCSKSSKRKG